MLRNKSISLGLLTAMSANICFMSDTSSGETQPTAETAKPKDNFNPQETVYFGPSQLEAAQEYGSKIMAYCESKKIPFFSNLKEDTEIKPGFGLLIQPVQKRDKAAEKLALTSVAICEVPDISAVAANDKGAAYLRAILQEAFGRRIKQNVVASIKAKQSPTLPDTLEGFIESIRARSPLYTFNQLQERVRKSLEKKNVKVSKEMLQGILMSKSFAEQMYPDTVQTQWAIVIDRMITVAKAENLDPAILEEWKETRDNAAFSHAGEVNLDDIEI